MRLHEAWLCVQWRYCANNYFGSAEEGEGRMEDNTSVKPGFYYQWSKLASADLNFDSI
jgi:hypothetical protein